MHGFVYDGIYDMGYKANLGDTNPYPLQDAPANAAWQRGYNDMVVDAMADDDWPMD